MKKPEMDNSQEVKIKIKKTADDLIYLLCCAFNEEVPSADRYKKMNLPNVYRLASMHYLASAAAYALEQVMELPREFDQAKKKAIRKLSLFEIERSAVFGELEKAGIWYLPLKGIVLGEYYPKTAMREMSDNDILCDPTKMSEVREVMTSLGFTCTEYGKIHHDIYQKGIMTFEMHSKLFNRADHPEAFYYYNTIKERLIKDDDNLCGYHMTDEDFYIYCVKHMYKHFSKAGTGLRSLLDIYILNKVKGMSLDRGYISSELDHFGLREYELKTRQLAENVFSLQPLSESEKEELAFYAYSGSHGTIENAIAKELEHNDSKKAKRRYILRRIFPTGKDIELNNPTVYHHMVLYPFWIVYRPFKGLVKKRRKISAELKALKEYRKTDDKTDS